MTSQMTLASGKLALQPSKAGLPRTLGEGQREPSAQENEPGHSPGREQQRRRPTPLTFFHYFPWESGFVWEFASSSCPSSGRPATQTQTSWVSTVLCSEGAWQFQLVATPGSRGICSCQGHCWVCNAWGRQWAYFPVSYTWSSRTQCLGYGGTLYLHLLFYLTFRLQ